MKPVWYIETDVYDDGNPNRMMDIVRSLGMEVVWFRYPGFGGDIETNNPRFANEDDCVIVYGSINAAMYLQRKKPWIPGVWCDFKELRCSNYLAYWGEYSLQQNYAFLPLAEVYRKKDWIFQVFGSEGLVFIRPDDNAKSFHGELVAKERFEDWWETANVFFPGEKCMTLVSQPSKIEAEYRFVISERRVLTGSQYRFRGEIEYSSNFPDEAANLAEEIADSCGFNPHPMYIMDICKLGDQKHYGQYRLMEIGSVNCAGLYACDLMKFVEKASELGAAEWQDLQ
jgi:hypothetical protein